MLSDALRVQQTSDDEAPPDLEDFSGVRRQKSLPRTIIAFATAATIVLLGVLAWSGSSPKQSSVAISPLAVIGEAEDPPAESTAATSAAPSADDDDDTAADDDDKAADDDDKAADDDDKAADDDDKAADDDDKAADDDDKAADDDDKAADDDDEKDEEKQEEDVNYLSEECLTAFLTVTDELTAAYKDFLEKCEGVDTSGKPEELPEACSKAIDTYWSTHQKMPDFEDKTGEKCIHEKFMSCDVAQVINGTDFSHKACMPKVCKPLNMVMNGINAEKKSGLCDKPGADCSLSVTCAGHEKVTKEMAQKTGKKSGAIGNRAGLAMTAIAAAFCFW